jgi:flagellar assembly protein FliH
MNVIDRSRTAGVLYAEDFDEPVPLPEPEAPPPPMFDLAQLEAAQLAAHAEGLAAGQALARQSQQQATVAALDAIAASLADARAVVEQAAERDAEALAGLLLACLRRVLPDLCRLHGVGEARAVARAVLPGLLHEPQITVRADAATAAAVAAEIAAHEPDLAARVRTQPMAQMAPGDVRIGWADGSAQRDVAALWRAIAAALEPVGLRLPVEPPPPPLAPVIGPPMATAPAATEIAAPTPVPITGDPITVDPIMPDPITADDQTQELQDAG